MYAPSTWGPGPGRSPARRRTSGPGHLTPTLRSSASRRLAVRVTRMTVIMRSLTDILHTRCLITEQNKVTVSFQITEILSMFVIIYRWKWIFWNCHSIRTDISDVWTSSFSQHREKLLQSLGLRGYRQKPRLKDTWDLRLTPDRFVIVKKRPQSMYFQI